MAMVVTPTKRLATLSGGVVIDQVSIVGDTSYPTGGSAGLAAGCKHAQTYAFLVTVGTGFDLDYIPGTDLLKVYNSGGGGAGTKATEVANATNLSANTFIGIAIGQVSQG
ncbi:MAG TPA: hypothetical protein VFW33_12550 [Gemmataceae bacterium]|nr:hypothetical protein [Gemmataceae bacterium]